MAKNDRDVQAISKVINFSHHKNAFFLYSLCAKANGWINILALRPIGILGFFFLIYIYIYIHMVECFLSFFAYQFNGPIFYFTPLNLYLINIHTEIKI